MSGPLEGVRVLDLSTVFMGPYATLLLAGMGADVVKVEPLAGDIARHVGVGRSAGMGPVFLNANAGKRSVVLDLKSESGREALFRVVEGVDVFVHNLRPKPATRLGVDAEQVLARNPRCVHCSFRGFGDGPYVDQPAYDDVVQAVAGVADVQGGKGAPTYVATPMADKTVALAGVAAIVSALFRRERTGRGEAVVVPMFEFMASYLLLEQQGGKVFDPPTGPVGYARTASPHRRPYATKDGFLSVVVYTDAQWRRFFEIAGLSELGEDARFRTIGGRTGHTDELYAAVGEAMATRTSAEWLEVLKGADIPAMPVNTVDDLFDDEHLAATGFFEIVEHPSEGRLRQARFPLGFSAGSAMVRPAPRLGQHTREVLTEHGLSVTEVDALLACGAAVAEGIHG